jgi:hypothetical protein
MNKPTPQALWGINSDISWQWHLNFIGQYQQHNYYLYYVIDRIMNQNSQITKIIELGTGYGALTMVLGLWGIKKNIPVYTVDIRPNKIEPIQNVLDCLKVIVLAKDIYSDETTKYLQSIIGNEPVLMICDGLDKSIEMNTWVPLLPNNSIVCGHDYRTECIPEKIKDITDKHCIPFEEENWEKLNVQLVVYKTVK